MKQYRIKLFEGADGLSKEIAILAAKSNGGAYLPIEKLQGVVEAEKLLYPSMNGGKQAEVIGENLLHIDMDVGGKIETVLSIEEIEVMEVMRLEDDTEVIAEYLTGKLNGQAMAAHEQADPPNNIDY